MKLKHYAISAIIGFSIGAGILTYIYGGSGETYFTGKMQFDASGQAAQELSGLLLAVEQTDARIEHLEATYRQEVFAVDFRVTAEEFPYGRKVTGSDATMAAIMTGLATLLVSTVMCWLIGVFRNEL